MEPYKYHLTILFSILLTLSSVVAKGGGGKGGGGGGGGGGHGSRAGTGNDKGCGMLGMILFLDGWKCGFGFYGCIAIILLVFICLNYYCKCCRDGANERLKEVPCYLCCKIIPIEDWIPVTGLPGLHVVGAEGEKVLHRVVCAEEHKSYMAANHAEQPDIGVGCGMCGGVLRLWTDKRMMELENNDQFICDSCHPDLDFGVGNTFCEITNKKDNRYNCFKCDYDLCKKCVQKIAKKKAEEEKCSENLERVPV